MFNIEKLSYIIIGTIICFGWIFKYKDKIAKYILLFLMSLYLIYSGIGGALNVVPNNYLWYYFIFTISISTGLAFSLKSSVIKKNRLSWIQFEQYLDYYNSHLASKIITWYYFILIIPLVFPEFKLFNIIHPPSPDLTGIMDERFKSAEASSGLTSVLNLVKQIIFPFFLLSLYRYRYKTIKLSCIIIGSNYIGYCDSGYLSRGSMIMLLVTIIAFTVIFRPKLGKSLLIGSLIFIPVFIVFLVQYSITRIGGEAEQISTLEAIEILLSQESGYPEHFSQILKIGSPYTVNYLIWLFTLPLPGFFRGGIDVSFNVLFSELMLGVSRDDNFFYILLPGMVGESVFLIGKYLFWINGLIYGLLTGFVYNVLSSHKQFFGILVTAMFNLCYAANRAGVVSVLPFVLKILLYFLIILLFLKKLHLKKLKKRNEKNFNGSIQYHTK